MATEIVNLVKKVPEEHEQPLRPNIHFLKTCEIGEDYVLKCMEDCWAEQADQRPDFGMIRSKLKPMMEGK